MLNNKKTFDVLTPLSDIHRVSKHIAEVVNNGTTDLDVTFTAEPGIWVSVTNYGVVDKPTEGTVGGILKGLSHLCLTGANGGTNPYEASDVKVGSVTVVREPGTRVFAGEYFFNGIDWNTIGSGDLLSVNGDGKLERVTPTGSHGFVNAIVEEADKNAKTIIYIIADGLTEIV